jgi:dTDP-4-dehydrorhamnose reductase
VVRFQKNRIQPSGKKSDLAKKILITGASGMLGATLVDRWQNSFDVFATDKSNFAEKPAKIFMAFDLMSETYDALMNWARPDVIIHCAAITNVDYCEDNPEQAMEVNAESVNKFLKYGLDAKLIFISSDAVFPDGIHMATEKDQTTPENVYGKTKEAGEKYIKDASGDHIAIRTTIVGKNINPSHQGFVEWIVNTVKNGKEITLFEDVLFTPITTWHLANELEWIMENDVSGVIHIAGQESISKYDFGKKICEGLELDTELIRKGSMDNVKFNAKRSNDQTMDSGFYHSLSSQFLPSADETADIIVEHFQESTYA